MTPETFPEPDDDAAFLHCVDRIIAGLIDQHAPERLYLIRITNWFDHKWLRFSGIGRVPFDGLSIHTDRGWRLGRVKGASIAEIESLLLRNLKPQVQFGMP